METFRLSAFGKGHVFSYFHPMMSVLFAFVRSPLPTRHTRKRVVGVGQSPTKQNSMIPIKAR
jgi:hypothetical protein